MKLNLMFDNHPFLVEYYWDSDGKFILVSMEHEYPSLMFAWLSSTTTGRAMAERFLREAEEKAKAQEYQEWTEEAESDYNWIVSSRA